MKLSLSRLALESRIRKSFWLISLTGKGIICIRWTPKDKRKKSYIEDAENYRTG